MCIRDSYVIGQSPSSNIVRTGGSSVTATVNQYCPECNYAIVGSQITVSGTTNFNGTFTVDVYKRQLLLGGLRHGEKRDSGESRSQGKPISHGYWRLRRALRCAYAARASQNSLRHGA